MAPDRVGKLAGADGDGDDLGQSVGAALVCGAGVVGSGGDQERRQCCGKTGGCFGVEDAVDGVHPVEHRGEAEPAASEVFLGVPG